MTVTNMIIMLYSKTLLMGHSSRFERRDYVIINLFQKYICLSSIACLSDGVFEAVICCFFFLILILLLLLCYFIAWFFSLSNLFLGVFWCLFNIVIVIWTHCHFKLLIYINKDERFKHETRRREFFLLLSF